MPVSQAGESELPERLRNVPFQLFIQSPQQHVGSVRRVSMHCNDGVATRDEIESSRFIELTAGQVQTIEIVAGRPQSLKKIQAVFIARDQSRNIRRASFNPPTVRCEHRHAGPLARYDLHGVVDALDKVPRQIVI